MKIAAVGMIVLMLQTSQGRAIDLDALFYQSTVGCEPINGASNPASQCRTRIDPKCYENLSSPVGAKEGYGAMYADAGRVIEILERGRPAGCFAEIAGEDTVCRPIERLSSQPGCGDANAPKAPKREHRYQFDRFSVIFSVRFLETVSSVAAQTRQNI